MSDITITQVSPVTLESLRQGVADAVKRAYGAERDYAIKVCEVLPFAWYLVEHNDKGEDAKQVHAEKKALFKALNEAEHTNPSTVWARVRKYAQEHIEGKQEKPEGSTDTSVGARHNRSLNLRLIEELSTLFKACKNAESLSDREQDAQTYITSALIALGVDTGAIE